MLGAAILGISRPNVNAPPLPPVAESYCAKPRFGLTCARACCWTKHLDD